MLPNPGGQLSPAEVLGRDPLIKHLWQIFEGQGVVLTAERRMGKTCVVKKMEAEPPEDRLPIYRDVEGVRSCLEFVEIVFHDVERYLSGLTRTAERVRTFLSSLRGAKIGNVLTFPDTEKQHWKILLTKTVEDLVEHQERKVIFFWDEVPLMLYNIAKSEGPQAAMELLDTLRSLRQMHPGFRMVFTGSVGMPNVISSLKRKGYANDPTNDMQVVDVPPLSQTDAEALTSQLLTGSGLRTDDLETTSRAIAAGVDGIAYLIHDVVGRLAFAEAEATPDAANRLIEKCLVDAQDPWHLNHYRERIDTYYEAEEVPLALAILDAIASGPISFDELSKQGVSKSSEERKEQLRRVIALLEQDHYIVHLSSDAWAFRFPLIQRYWRLKRGLTA